MAGQACATSDDQREFPGFGELGRRFPEDIFQPGLALEVLAEVGESYSAGQGPTGERRVVPIIGGRFRGKGLSGVVLPGADRQLVRSDGIRELDATYELKADDGTIIMVRNRVTIDAEQPPEGWDRYARSFVQLTAPHGPHDWLNRRVILGTLHSLRPERPLVLLRFFVWE
jgi:hypothetical protein